MDFSRPCSSSDQCQIYPRNGSACSNIFTSRIKYNLLGSKYVYIGKFSSIAHRINNYYLDDLVNIIPVIFPYQYCDYYLALLLCHYFFPVCVPNTRTGCKNSSALCGRQNVCEKTCNYFHNDLCEGLTTELNRVLQNHVSNLDRQPDTIHRIFNKKIYGFVNSQCMNYTFYNENKGNFNEEEGTCFYEEGNQYFLLTQDSAW